MEAGWPDSNWSGTLLISCAQVRRDYSAFEKFQRDLLVAFPELKLPALPRKFHVFMNETDIEERMVCFDCVMKVIAKHKTMCTSPPVLEFLGFSLIADKKYFKVIGSQVSGLVSRCASM